MTVVFEEAPDLGAEVERQAVSTAVIDRGNAFPEVGEALAGIRDRRLYRASHDAFQ